MFNALCLVLNRDCDNTLINIKVDIYWQTTIYVVYLFFSVFYEVAKTKALSPEELSWK